MNLLTDTAYLSSAYLGSIEYFQALVNYPNIYIEQYDHYIKQTYRNRCNIVGAEGIQSLIIPIVKPNRDAQCMKDIQISDHDKWNHLHWQAIKSAYKNSPYYDYFEEDFYKFYKKPCKFLFDFNNQLQNIVCELADLAPNIRYTAEYKSKFCGTEIDLRDSIHPKKGRLAATLNKRYYQVFEHKHGFVSNLSIIDLLFNKGPESIFYLDNRYL